jgi:hypothetical protein
MCNKFNTKVFRLQAVEVTNIRHLTRIHHRWTELAVSCMFVIVDHCDSVIVLDLCL